MEKRLIYGKTLEHHFKGTRSITSKRPFSFTIASHSQSLDETTDDTTTGGKSEVASPSEDESEFTYGVTTPNHMARRTQLSM